MLFRNRWYIRETCKSNIRKYWFVAQKHRETRNPININHFVCIRTGHEITYYNNNYSMKRSEYRWSTAQLINVVIFNNNNSLVERFESSHFNKNCNSQISGWSRKSFLMLSYSFFCNYVVRHVYIWRIS